MSSDMVVEVYPNRPIKLVVGFPPGGGADVVARHIAMYMTEDLGQKVIIDNRPGALGNIAAAAVARSDADGYTVYLAVRPVALHKAMYSNVDYDFAEDLVPVGMVVRVPYVLVMGKHVAATTLQDALMLARGRPGAYTCASPGPSSTNHFLCEDLQKKAAVTLAHVPYNGEIPALVDVIGGRADFAVTSVVAALPYIASDSVRAMAVFADTRVSAVASVPHMKELGYGDAQAQGWCAIMAPTGTPAHAISRLNQSINAALTNAVVRKKLVQLGYVLPAAHNTPEVLETFLIEDTEKWTEILQQRRTPD
ncbi:MULTISPECIES: tripartite tricarboxylate transporter substrate binding protein [unclassified Achromobacter]|uniref:Bug family tripartite tricarboxylate transporter substrate binding protein n=1 Tax=unclassified Achromobacter TaxID=2626865 RepID=UPI001303EE2B|nr:MULTISPECIES: tripartite tricarboxylate transporter substrate binding protein [unclassified Achromobacter]